MSHVMGEGIGWLQPSALTLFCMAYNVLGHTVYQVRGTYGHIQLNRHAGD